MKLRLKHWNLFSNRASIKETILTRLQISHTRITHSYLENPLFPLYGANRLLEVHLFLYSSSHPINSLHCFCFDWTPIHVLAEGPRFFVDQILPFLRSTNLPRHNLKLNQKFNNVHLLCPQFFWYKLLIDTDTILVLQIKQNGIQKKRELNYKLSNQILT